MKAMTYSAPKSSRDALVGKTGLVDPVLIGVASVWKCKITHKSAKQYFDWVGLDAHKFLKGGAMSGRG